LKYILKEHKKTVVLIVTILIIASSFYVRLIPYFKYSRYGIWLQYDDSMFEYWLSKTLYEKGVGYWYQLTPENTRHLWWWPEGRDVRRTETPGLSFTGALLYPVAKAFNLRLVDWVGIIPAFYGTLATAASALLGYTIGGPALAVLMATSTGYQYAFMQRSISSFVEKMAPCMFFGTLFLVTLALLLKRSNLDVPAAALLGALGGGALMLASAFWGGFLAFLAVTLIFSMLVLFFTDNEAVLKNLIIFLAASTITFLVTSKWITTIWMHKTWAFTLLLYSLSMVFAAAELLVLKKFDEEKRLKLWSVTLIASIIAMILIVTHPYVLRTYLNARYIMMVMPWTRRIESPLARSVAEHQGIFNVFAPNDLINVLGIGLAAPLALLIAVYYYFKGQKDELLHALPIIALGVFATYLVLTNVSVYMLTTVGYLSAIAGALALYWALKSTTLDTGSLAKLLWSTIALIAAVLLISGSYTGINYALNYPPPSFLSAGTAFYSPLFPDTMKVIESKCKFVLAWWDYGYMIGTVANRTTVVDPATLNSTKIAQVAKALIGNENDLLKVLNEFYLPKENTCIFTYEVFPLLSDKTVILIPQAGDFAKSVWMFRIAGFDDTTIFSKYIRLKYVVIGTTEDGRRVTLIVDSPNDVVPTQRGVLVRTPQRGSVLLRSVEAVTSRPLYDIEEVNLYKMIYLGLKKKGFTVLDSLGRKLNMNVDFRHLKLEEVVVDRLYLSNNRTLPFVGVAVVYKFR